MWGDLQVPGQLFCCGAERFTDQIRCIEQAGYHNAYHQGVANLRLQSRQPRGGVISTLLLGPLIPFFVKITLHTTPCL